MIRFFRRLFRRKEKSHLIWASDDLTSHESVKNHLFQNYLSNFNSKLDNGLNQD